MVEKIRPAQYHCIEALARHRSQRHLFIHQHQVRPRDGLVVLHGGTDTGHVRFEPFGKSGGRFRKVISLQVDPRYTKMTSMRELRRIERTILERSQEIVVEWT